YPTSSEVSGDRERRLRNTARPGAADDTVLIYTISEIDFYVNRFVEMILLNLSETPS
ncbi:MAG: hypothetical protein QOE16_461, partial [Microbacteriaceae bacterium]|nr:hypothetical protein [Microbacteriaceae bacterium]